MAELTREAAALLALSCEQAAAPEQARARIHQQLLAAIEGGAVSQTVQHVDASMARRAAHLARSGSGLGWARARLAGFVAALGMLGLALWWVQGSSFRSEAAAPVSLVKQAPVVAAASEPPAVPVAAPAADSRDADAARAQPAGVRAPAMQHDVVRARPLREAKPGAGAAGYRLEEETALIRSAARALREQQPGVALATLAEHARRFPDGALAQERRALHVLAGCAQGLTPAVVQERDGYLRTAGASPLAERVRKACGEAARAAEARRAAASGAP